MATSYNGYALVLNYGDPQLMPLTANGKPFAPNPGILRGEVGIVMNYLADWLDANIEPLDLAGYDKDDWCYTQKKVTGGDGSTWSCHFSATAFDYNAQKHGQHRVGTWLPWQKTAINKFLTEYLEGAVIWGENWSISSIDGMHFEAGRNRVLMAKVAAKIIAGGAPIPVKPTPKPDPIPTNPTPITEDNDMSLLLNDGKRVGLLDGGILTHIDDTAEGFYKAGVKEVPVTPYTFDKIRRNSEQYPLLATCPSGKWGILEGSKITWLKDPASAQSLQAMGSESVTITDDDFESLRVRA